MNFQSRILVVDDQPLLLKSYKLILQQQGYQVAGAATCQAALEHLDRSEFDVVMCDLGLDGGGSGFDVIDFAGRRYPRIQQLLLTGYASDEVREAAERRGIKVLHKPVGVANLLRILAAIEAQLVTAPSRKPA